MVNSVTYRIDNMKLILPSYIPGLRRESEIVKYVTSETSPENESCFTVATFKYDKDGYPELTFCGNRPLELTPDEFEKFMILVRDGYKYKKEYNGEYTER